MADLFYLYRGTRRLASRNRLLQFAMNCVAAEVRIVLLFLEALRVCLSVFLRRVTRRRSAFFARFCALESDDFDFPFFCHGRMPLH